MGPLLQSSHLQDFQKQQSIEEVSAEEEEVVKDDVSLAEGIPPALVVEGVGGPQTAGNVEDGSNIKLGR
ncbi:hypothetical protein ACS0TY_020563 [Phlomoides rotata]